MNFPSPSIRGTSSRPPKARDIKRRFLSKFYELAVDRKRQHEEYVAEQQQAGQLTVEAFDRELRREGFHFGSAINAGPWGHVDVTGKVIIGIRNLPVEVAVQIGELLREGSNLRGGPMTHSHREGK